MTIKKTTIADLEAFKNEAEKGRKIPLTDEDIKKINELSIEAEIADNENDSEKGIAAKKPEYNSDSTQI